MLAACLLLILPLVTGAAVPGATVLSRSVCARDDVLRVDGHDGPARRSRCVAARSPPPAGCARCLHALSHGQYQGGGRVARHQSAARLPGSAHRDRLLREAPVRGRGRCNVCPTAGSRHTMPLLLLPMLPHAWFRLLDTDCAEIDDRVAATIAASNVTHAPQCAVFRATCDEELLPPTPGVVSMHQRHAEGPGRFW